MPSALAPSEARTEGLEASNGSDLHILPQLLHQSYEPCTFDYNLPARFRDGQPLPSLKDWLEVFSASVPQFRSRAASDPTFSDSEERAERFASSYSRVLRSFEQDGKYLGDAPSCLALCALREKCLRQEGFKDVFKRVKDEENAKALQLLPGILGELDAITDHRERLQLALRGVFAGNIFDLGAASSADLFTTQGAAFSDTRAQLLEHPWAVDDLDPLLDRWTSKRYRKALLFVDNAGSDVVLGMLPLARELLRRGTAVVLAANSVPSINDVTAAELAEVAREAASLDKVLDRALAEGTLQVMPSGNDLPVIDLRRVSEEVVSSAGDADLVILEGMGRAIETNLHAQFSVDAVKLGMIKHKEVAQMLGGRLYDCVCKLSPGVPAAGS